MIGDKTFGDYVPPIYMVSLDLVRGPTKTTYQKGETFDKTGISMTATMSDGSTVSIPLAKIKVLGFTSTSKGQKNVSLSYTDESGVTLTKVIKVTIVDAENKDAEPKKGCGGTIVAISVIVAVVLIGAIVAVLVLKKNKKSA
jgi:beta-galactosidase